MRTRHFTASTATALRKSGPRSSCHIDQCLDSSGLPKISKYSSTSPERGMTPKPSSGADRPDPHALTYASFAVQQAKKAAKRWSAGCERNHSDSFVEKKRAPSCNGS